MAVKRGTGPARRRGEVEAQVPGNEDSRNSQLASEHPARQEREAAFFDEVTHRQARGSAGAAGSAESPGAARTAEPDEAGALEAAAAEAEGRQAPPTVIEGNLGTMLDWLGDLRGKRVLDLCCGTGSTSLLLAESGAEDVVGCDVSETSLDVARGRASALDPRRRPSFVRQDLGTPRAEWEGRFDVLFGSYALHHLDLDRCLPLLAGYLKPGGRSVFLETSARNPVLRWSRRLLTGRLGVPRYGTVDEQPLTPDDLQTISCHLGGCRVISSDYAFLRILDRQIFRYRSRTLTRACAAADRFLSRVYPAGSYHIVVACGPIGDRSGSYGF